MSWKKRLRRQRSDDELRLELDAYLEEEAAENRARGMSPEEAARQARIKLGNRQQVRETEWRQNGLALVEDLWRDLRYTVRTLGRAPGFAVLAVLVMALGIGANVALFTVVRSVLLKPLPFRDPDRLVMLYENSGGIFSFNAVSGGIYDAWARQNRSFDSLALAGGAEFNLSAEGGTLPEKLIGMAATANYLPTLGVDPALGRNFTAGEDSPDANRVVLLGWNLWKRRFASDPAILNKIVRLNGLTYTVIGVMPSWFVYPDARVQLWTPMRRYFPAKLLQQLGAHNYQSIGRLRAGVSQTQALADLSAISQRLHNEHLDNPFIAQAANIRPLLDDLVGDVRRPLYVLLAATGCVLLIACLNLANLLVARAAARQKELAIRAALGGSRWRLIRERITESLLLTAAGGAAGLALAFAAVQWLIHTRKDFSRVDSIGIDATVLLFTLGLILLCALLTGVIASIGVTGRNWSAALNDATRGSSAGHGRTRLRRVLLAAEVGLTVVLLVSAGLLLKSYARLRSADLGCTTRNILTMRLDLFGPRYVEPAAQVDTFRSLLDRVRALPGVEAAAMVTSLPGNGYPGDHDFAIVEHPPLPRGTAQFAIDVEADPAYFQTMGIPIVRGRSFDASRTLDNARELVINQAFARAYFPNEDPIGKHIRYPNMVWEIVGVVADTRYAVNEEPKPIEYYPLLSGVANNAALLIRTRGDAEQYALPVERIVSSIDRDLPVSDVLTMEQLLGKNTVDSSFNATLLGGFALLSLTLAAAGIFGVLSYVVTQRTNEIGIRMALGAGRAKVLSSVLTDGLRPALFGLALGLGASVAAVRLLRTMLYETQPLDPSVFLLVSVGLLAVAACACLVPAWRASRLNPVEALRIS